MAARAFVVLTIFRTLLFALLLPLPAAGQQSSGIAGVVRDTSGAVLPGVTVEAASAALIEKVRSVFTDDQGRYNIVDLRPGNYDVTFTLPGFGTVRRERVELSSGFTATVNVELQVGTLEETVTVTGASPLVDTSNVREQSVLSRDLLDTLPISTKHVNNVATLTPGFTGLGEPAGQYSTQLGGGTGVGASAGTPATFHGKSGNRVLLDGMSVENMQGIGNSSYQINAAVVQEMVLQTSGISADTNADGVVLNVIPRDGGNSFGVIATGLYTNEHFESDNFTDELRTRGLPSATTTTRVFDEAGSVGGPVRKDRLWFFGALRTWGSNKRYAGVFYNKTQGTPFFTPWTDRPVDRASGRWEWYDSMLGRLTWQASPRNKFNFTFDRQAACNCGSNTPMTAQEANFNYRFDPNILGQAVWNSPATSRLLFEAGTAAVISHWHRFLLGSPDDITIQDQGLGISYNNTLTYIGHPNDSDRYSQRFSASYVTGTHAFKTGVTIEEGVRNTLNRVTGNGVGYVFVNQVPTQINLSGGPWFQEDNFIDLGIYGQDQWRIDRLTLNLGLRFDYYYGWIPAQQVPATRFLPERTFAAVKGVPSYKDLNPRVGAAYDLFGTGRTALKLSLGRYLKKFGTTISDQNNPITTSVNLTGRAWNDANRNYVPDCELTNFAAHGECGPIQNQSFGKTNPLANRWADDALRGFGIREYNWDLTAEVEHELRPGVSVSAGYYRNWYGNFLVIDNLEVTPADFDPFCITAPLDARLPGGGGHQVCAFDLKPGKFGQVSNLVTQASHFGNPQRANDYFNVSINTRLGRGIQFGGGVDTGRSVNDTCVVVDNPQFDMMIGTVGTPVALGRQFCRVVTPFGGQTQVKLHGSYSLPFDVVVSGAYQDLSGPTIEAVYAASTAEIAPSLGRNLAGGARTTTLQLMEPQTAFDPRIRRLDLRVSKTVRMAGRGRIQLNLDAYNVTNSNSIRATNTSYGSRWLNVNSLLDPRIFVLGATFSY
jgi:carboxypeptidase family protein